MIKITIHGRFPGINEYTETNRKNPYAGASMKRQAQTKAEWVIRQQLGGPKLRYPVTLHYCFFEPNRRRDKDNIAGFAHKVIQDALVKCGVLRGDGWDYVEGFTDSFAVDRADPRIEITIEEHGDENA